MPGALVLSLDFELHWGVRDIKPIGHPYTANLLGAREAIPRMLALFAEHGVEATWAFVGMLGCAGAEDWHARRPDHLPAYEDANLSPYAEPVGADEQADPLHFAPSLVREIAATPGQELGSHTFSHYYALEPGQTAEQFAADLEAVRGIHADLGLPPPRSIVLPRNQINPAYEPILFDHGFDVVRGNQRSWMYRHGDGPSCRPRHRIGRLADAHVPASGHHLTGWDELWQPSGLCDVPASLFLRPCGGRGRALERLRLRRIFSAMRAAAEGEEIFHLWWHPHNFGAHTGENLAFLSAILRELSALRDSHGMISASMGSIADRSRR